MNATTQHDNKHYLESLQLSILNWPNVKTGTNKDWKAFDDDFKKACEKQYALYLQGKWRLQNAQ